MKVVRNNDFICNLTRLTNDNKCYVRLISTCKDDVIRRSEKKISRREHHTTIISHTYPASLYNTFIIKNHCCTVIIFVHNPTVLPYSIFIK